MPSITRRPSKTREEPGKVECQVLETVERLLEGGATYTELGIVQIAADAGAARSTFYVHYRDKSDLLIRLTETATERLFAEAGAWVRESGGADELVRTTREVIREYRNHAALHRRWLKSRATSRRSRPSGQERSRGSPRPSRRGFAKSRRPGTPGPTWTRRWPHASSPGPWSGTSPATWRSTTAVATTTSPPPSHA